MKPLPPERSGGAKWLTSAALNASLEANAALAGEFNRPRSRKEYLQHLADARPLRTGKPSTPDFVWQQRMRELINHLYRKQRNRRTPDRPEEPILGPEQVRFPDESLRAAADKDPANEKNRLERERAQRRRDEAKQREAVAA